MDFQSIIRRPIFMVMMAIAIVFLGLVSLGNLPIEQYPNIAPPTVKIQTQYPGASAEAVLNSVVSPIEQSINGVEDMIYMKSTCTSAGRVEIYVYFRQGTDPDMAAVNVQNRVAKVTSRLPAEVNQIGVSTSKVQNSMLEIFAIYSPDDTYNTNFLSNYASIFLEQEIARIEGVGEMRVVGGDYSMRIWLYPDVMAQYGLIPQDINAVLAEQNIEASTGAIGENSAQTFKYTMKYSGRLQKPEEFENMVIKSLPDGSVLRLKDVAEVELGKDSYNFEGTVDGHPGITCMIYQTAGSNATEVINQVEAFIDKAKEDLPRGVDIKILFSNNDFLFASIENVVITLILAIILVTIVVFFFLQDYRATLIPVLSTIVSLIGAFAFMTLAGFSINLLTLFSLVLVIGTVVDNSIVVVEAVQSKFDAGYPSAFQATKDAMKDVTAAIISCTLVFMAVFIPVAFMGGTTGIFYTQFGLTMAVAVGISAFNSLTMCPALCAILMRPGMKTVGLLGYTKRFYDKSYGYTLGKYVKSVHKILQRRWIVALLIVAAFSGFFFMILTTKTAMVPNEDVGAIFVDVTTAPGNTLAETEKIMTDLEEIIKQFDEITSYNLISGFSMISGQGTNFGSGTLRLKDWSDRPGAEHNMENLLPKINAALSNYKNAIAFAFSPPMIIGYGNSAGFELQLQDRTGGDINEFEKIANDFIQKLNQRPEIAMAYTSFSTKYPQYRVDVDAAKCKRAGVSPTQVLGVLGGYCGGVFASQFNRFSKVYYVTTEAIPSSRETLFDLDNMFVRTAGGMAPVSEFVTLTKVYGAESISRFNLYTSILINGVAADGYSSGDAIKAIGELAKTSLPRGYSYEYAGMAREESGDSSSTIFIFIVIIVLVYIILSSLYESIFIPLAVILSVPFGLFGSFLFAKCFGLENNIYLQTGLIMLIGLLSKTAILITQFATVGRRCGLSIEESAYNAAKERLRPILMTALTMIFGLLPMMFSTGVGANGNRSLGTGAVGGMVIGTLALLFVVPVLYAVFQEIHEKFSKVQMKRPDSQHKQGIDRIREVKAGLPIIIVCLLLTSCGTYKKYSQPENLQVDSTFVGENLDTTQTLASVSWREFFNDKLLENLIDSALNYNLDLKTAQLNIQKAEAALKVSKQAYIPSVNFAPAGNIGKYKSNDPTYAGDVSLVAQWQLDIFGSLTAAKRRSQAGLEASNDFEQAVYTQLISTIADAYFTLIALDKELEIAENTAESWKNNVETIKKLMEAGMANEASVAQMTASYYNVQTMVVDLRENITVLENNISTIVGKNLKTIDRTELENISLSTKLEVGLPMNLLQNRPDVRQAEKNLAQNFYSTVEAKDAFYPKITITGTAGFANVVAYTILNPGGSLFTIAGSLLQPIYNGGRLKAQSKIAKLNYEQALESFQQKILSASMEVNNALCHVKASEERKSLIINEIDALKEAEHSTTLMMLHGSSTYLEVLVAQQSLLSAQLSEVTNNLSELESLVELYVSVGGGK